MITFKKGNLLEAKTQALVNTVNTVGVMGKGIALQFKEAYPNNFKEYVTACKKGDLKPGKLLVVHEQNLECERLIVNFPTKTEWFKKSKYEYIEEGLKDLVKVIDTYQIKSIAIPPLGCGNGGLQWNKVKDLILKYLQPLSDIEIVIYEPNEAVKELLKRKTVSKEIKLTPARAMLLYALFYYESMGEESNLFIANKLAWFLQRLGENLRLTFEQSHYGPYSVQVGHVLHALNGTYLKGLEQMTARPFDPIELNYDTFTEIKQYIEKQLSEAQQQRIKNLIQLIDGFQSALSLEILASVDYIRKSKPLINEKEITQSIQQWSNRKRNLFQEQYINIALKHLNHYSSHLSFQ